MTVRALRSKPKTLEWRSDDQSRADAAEQLATQDSAASRHGRSERGPNVPAFRDFPQDLLQMETALRRTRRGRLGCPYREVDLARSARAHRRSPQVGVEPWCTRRHHSNAEHSLVGVDPDCTREGLRQLAYWHQNDGACGTVATPLRGRSGDAARSTVESRRFVQQRAASRVVRSSAMAASSPLALSGHLPCGTVRARAGRSAGESIRRGSERYGATG